MRVMMESTPCWMRAEWYQLERFDALFGWSIFAISGGCLRPYRHGPENAWR